MTDAISNQGAAAIIPGAAGSQAKAGSQSSMDFYNLLTAQLTNQNPLEPMKETEFLGQMAQFSTVEQLQQLGKTMTQSQADQTWLNAQSFLGREVQWSSEVPGVSHAGTVERLHRDAEGGIWLQVNGREVPLGEVSVVSPSKPAAADHS